MTKGATIWIIVAVSLILIGTIIFGGVMTVLNWDFTKLGTQNFETNTYEFEEDFENISIKSDTAKIVLELSDDEKCRVECYEDSNMKHDAVVANGILTIKVSDERKWYDHIGIYSGSAKITVYLPKSEYAKLMIKNSTGAVEISKDIKFDDLDISLTTGSVKLYASVSNLAKIKTNTGAIFINNASLGALDLTATTGDITLSSVICQGNIDLDVSTGKATLTDVDCQSLISTGSTGNVIMSDTVASGKLDIKRSTGSVTLDDCDAGEIVIKTDTGSVRGTLLSEKVFIAHSDTGRVSVPKTTNGGRCEITTDTGSIKILIRE